MRVARKIITIINMALIAVLPFGSSQAQVSVEWAATYSGTATESADFCFAVVVGQSGNVYVTGQVQNAGNNIGDYSTIKYNRNGDTLWVRVYPDSPPTYGAGLDIALDQWGNVYVTGVPFTIKYDSSGNQLWATDNDVHNIRIAIDDSGYIYLAGTRLAVIHTTRLDPSGNILWQERFEKLDQLGNETYGMALDPWENVIVVGRMYVPGGNHYDYITLKYSPQGDTLWTKRYNGAGGPSVPLDIPYALDIDSLGNIYVTGESRGVGTGTDYLTIKYDRDGNQIWTARYNGPNNAGDAAYDIALDGDGNVYVTGISDGYNYTTLKYDSSGALLWSATYPGSGPAWATIPPKIALDALGYAYVSVRGEDGQWNSDLAVVKYDPNGNTVWEATYPRPNAAEGTNDLVIDGAGNIYLTGTIGLGTFEYDYLTVKFLQEPLSVNEDYSTPPQVFKLYQNYPNPFNPSTTIAYDLPHSGFVTLKIFNLLGQEVATLVNEHKSAGHYQVVFNAKGLASGVYLYRLQAGSFIQAKKMLLMR